MTNQFCWRSRPRGGVRKPTGRFSTPSLSPCQGLAGSGRAAQRPLAPLPGRQAGTEGAEASEDRNDRCDREKHSTVRDYRLNDMPDRMQRQMKREEIAITGDPMAPATSCPPGEGQTKRKTGASPGRATSKRRNECRWLTHVERCQPVIMKEKGTQNRMCVCPRHWPPGPEPPFFPLGTSAEAKLSHRRPLLAGPLQMELPSSGFQGLFLNLCRQSKASGSLLRHMQQAHLIPGRHPCPAFSSGGFLTTPTLALSPSPPDL